MLCLHSSMELSGCVYTDWAEAVSFHQKQALACAVKRKCFHVREKQESFEFATGFQFDDADFALRQKFEMFFWKIIFLPTMLFYLS